MQGRNIIGISDTGTGKTFLSDSDYGEVDSSLSVIQAVITAPTRESFALQIYNRCEKWVVDPKLRTVWLPAVWKIQNERTAEGTAAYRRKHRRIKDLFLQEQTLRVDTADIMVVDEADMTLEFGFLEDADIAEKWRRIYRWWAFQQRYRLHCSSF